MSAEAKTQHLTADPDADRTEYEAAIGQLDSAIMRLDGHVSNLAGKLTPFLGPDEQTDKRGDMPISQSSPAVNELRQLRSAIERIADSVYDLAERVR